MLTKEPINILENNVLNYIPDNIDTNDKEYVENYEQISLDRKDVITVETHSISNCINLIISQRKNKFNKICDIGTGTGHIILNAPIINKTAIDISYNWLKLLPDTITKIRCNAESIPIKNETFDIITLTDILEHVINPEEVISESYRMLKPKGTLIFAAPFNQDLSVYDSSEYKQKYKQYSHVHLRSITWDTINNWFDEKFNLISHTFITSHMQFQTLKQYSIVFCEFIKK
jgi:ubiquinone/menaquinone biosynthesis C-methylase UbiE